MSNVDTAFKGQDYRVSRDADGSIKAIVRLEYSNAYTYAAVAVSVLLVIGVFYDKFMDIKDFFVGAQKLRTDSPGQGLMRMFGFTMSNLVRGIALFVGMIVVLVILGLREKNATVTPVTAEQMKALLSDPDFKSAVAMATNRSSNETQKTT